MRKISFFCIDKMFIFQFHARQKNEQEGLTVFEMIGIRKAILDRSDIHLPHSHLPQA